MTVRSIVLLVTAALASCVLSEDVTIEDVTTATACDIQLSPLGNRTDGSHLNTLLTAWQNSGHTGATVCLSSGEFTIDTSIVIPAHFSLVLEGFGMDQTTLMNAGFQMQGGALLVLASMTISGHETAIAGSADSFLASSVLFSGFAYGVVGSDSEFGNFTLINCVILSNGAIEPMEPL